MTSFPRIAIATEHVGRSGGAGVYVLDLVGALCAAGHEILVVADRVDAAVPEGATVATIPGLAEFEVTPSVQRSYTDALADFAPAVVHVHHLYDPALVALTRRHAPLVWGVHDYVCASGDLYFRPGQECGRAHGPGCIPRMALHRCTHTWDMRSFPRNYRYVTRFAGVLRDVDVALAFSAFLRRNLETNQIPAVDVAPFVEPPAAADGAAVDGRILFVGRLSSTKGLGQLIHALRSIDGTLDVCGDGWWAPKAERLARRLGVADRIRFLGWLRPDELEAAYRRAAVVAIPSLWPEPFGIVGLEAMAHARPVVASRTGGIPEWLVDGVTGVLTPPGDVRALASALQRLLADRDLRARMGAAGAVRVRRRYTTAAHLDALGRVHGLARDRWAQAQLEAV